MSILAVLTTLQRIHDAHGRLTEIRGYVDTFGRAARFNPRRSDDWDVLGVRDADLTRVNRAVQRSGAMFARIRRERETAPDRSREMADLFAAWAEAYARYGQGSREEQRAGQAFYTVQLQWADVLTTQERQAAEARERLERYQGFYENLTRLFGDLKRLAEQYVRYWPESSHKPQALAAMLQFEECENSARRISTDITTGLHRVGQWQGDISAAQATLRTWLRWSANQRTAMRDVAGNRIPV